MDLIKFRDFLGRLDQAHQQAVQSGDKALADRYGALIDQAHQHAQNAAMKQGQQGPQGQEGAAGVPGMPKPTRPSPGRTIGNSTPPDVAREVAQEQGSSWIDKLFSAGPSVGAPVVMPQGDTPRAQVSAATPPAPQTRGNLQWAADQLSPDSKTNIAAAAAANLNPAIGGARIGSKVFDNILGWIWPEGHPGQVKGTGDKPGDPSMPQAAQDNYGFENTESPRNLTPHDEEAQPLPPPPKEDPYKKAMDRLGPSPEESGGVMDVLGLLLGGKNYLNMRAGQQKDWNDKKFQIGQDVDRSQDQEKYHQMANDIQKQHMAVEYAKALAEEQYKQDSLDAGDSHSIMNALGHTMDPKSLSQNPLFMQQVNRQKRAQQIETKKGN